MHTQASWQKKKKSCTFKARAPATGNTTPDSAWPGVLGPGNALWGVEDSWERHHTKDAKVVPNGGNASSCRKTTEISKKAVGE